VRRSDLGLPLDEPQDVRAPEDAPPRRWAGRQITGGAAGLASGALYPVTQ
jgi:hypothetical protein